MRTFAVIGAGHAGMPLAGYLALQGQCVRLFARNLASVGAAARDVRLEGAIAGRARLELVTDDIGRAVEGADVVMVAVPASAHADLARACAPHLTDGQAVLLNPGRTAGAIEFARALRDAGGPADVTVGEAQSFLFASRVTGPGRARIYRIKRRVPVAALPASRTGELLWRLAPLFPQFEAARWVWQTSLDNIGAMFHPAITLLNAGRIEGCAPFEFYCGGVTPSVAQVIERLDAERLSVAHALGVRATSARDWLAEAYGAVGATLCDAIRANPAYAGIAAPATLAHRYVAEDVPTGLVPIASLGDLLGVPTPATDGLIELANSLHGRDYRSVGRTLERLGLGGLTPGMLREFALEGSVPSCRRRAASSERRSATASM